MPRLTCSDLSQQDTNTDLPRWIVIFLLLGILVLGAGLRFKELDRNSLWSDESASVIVARRSPSKILEYTINEDVHPPIYYLLLHFVIQVFESPFVAEKFHLPVETVARFPSALFGLGTIVLMFLLARSLWKSSAAGLAAALLTAVSAWQLNYSQEARSYAMLGFLSVGSFWTFYRWLVGIYNNTDKHSKLNGLLWAVFTMFALLTHNNAFLGLFVQYLFVSFCFCKNQKNRRNLLFSWLLLQISIAVPVAIWLLFGGFQQITKVVANHYGLGWVPLPTLHTLFLCFLEFSGAITTCCQGVVFDKYDQSASLLALSIIAVLGIGSFLQVCKESGKEKLDGEASATQSPFGEQKLIVVWTEIHLLLLMWLFVPLLIAFIVSYLNKPVFVSRTLITSSFPFLLLAVGGLVGSNKKTAVWRILAFAVCVAAFGSCCEQYFHNLTRCNWRRAWQYIERTAASQDILLFDTAAWPEFYCKRRDLRLRHIAFLNGELTVEEAREIAKAIATTPRVWLIRSHSLDFNRIIPQLIEHLIPFNRRIMFHGIELLCFQREGRPLVFTLDKTENED